MEDIFQILIFVAFAVLSFLPQVLKEKNKPASPPHSSPAEADEEDWLSEEYEEEETMAAPVVQEPAINKESVVPSSFIAQNVSHQSGVQEKSASQTSKKVRLNSRAEARRAFIHSEIFNRKYQ